MDIKKETLDELSKKTLGSYLDKARKEIPSRSKTYDNDYEASKKKDPKVYDHDDSTGKKLNKSFSKLNSRLKGMSTANDKIKEEEMTIENLSDEQTPEDVITIEESTHYHSVWVKHKKDSDWSHEIDLDDKEDVPAEKDSLKHQVHKVKVIKVHKSEADWRNPEHKSAAIKKLSEASSSDLINNILSGDSIEIENSFEFIMKEKIADRLDSFRKEIAQGMFNESKEISDEQILEDILALDELSSETLKSYINKSVFNHTKNTSRSFTQKNTADKKRAVKNRILGITRASDRLTKEQVETIESILEESKEYKVGSEDHYRKWVKDKGHLTYSASSVLSDYSKKHSLDKEAHNKLVKSVFSQHEDRIGLLK